MATPASSESPLIYASEDDWARFLDRRARLDTHGYPMGGASGWKADVILKWRSPVRVGIVGVAHAGVRATLRYVLNELSSLLNLEFQLVDGSQTEGLSIICHYADSFPLNGLAVDGIAHRDTKIAWRQGSDGVTRRYYIAGRVEIAVRVSNQRLIRAFYHELLHVLVNIEHADAGIMAVPPGHGFTYSLNAEDRRQLQLFGNPLITSGMAVSEVQRMAVFGKPPSAKGGSRLGRALCLASALLLSGAALVSAIIYLSQTG